MPFFLRKNDAEIAASTYIYRKTARAPWIFIRKEKNAS